jgi:uncharacterized membrane protein
MDTNQVVFAIVCALIGALALLLVYMAARMGAADGVKDVEAEKLGGKRK